MASPTDGQATAAVCELLASKLGLPKSAVGIARGETSRDKHIVIEGIAFDDALDKLRR